MLVFRKSGAWSSCAKEHETVPITMLQPVTDGQQMVCQPTSAGLNSRISPVPLPAAAPRKGQLVTFMLLTMLLTGTHCFCQPVPG
jgi:hypothetical protein